jgi:hypothetical protein
VIHHLLLHLPLVALWSLDPIADITAAVSGISGLIQGNQQYKKNKGLISQAYRQNVAQTNLQQANTRQDSNESLNARGVLSGGAARPNPSSITQAVAGSGGSGGGGGITGYLPQAGVGAVGAANTLGGGQNAQMTDQFALADKANKGAETAALNANSATYANTILNAATGAAGAAGNVIQGQSAGNAAAAVAAGSGANGTAGSATPPIGSIAPDTPSPTTGAYGMTQNPQFFGGSSGTSIGSGQPNYSFNAGTG